MNPDLQLILLHSHNKEEITTYLKYHPEGFQEAIDATISNELNSWRLPWLLWSCMKNNDTRLQNHIDQFLEILPERKDGQQRELLKILNRMDLTEPQEIKLLDTCIKIWINEKLKVSTRFNALKGILKITSKYPELANEVVLLTDSHYTNSLSSGAKKSVSVIQRELMSLQEKK